MTRLSWFVIIAVGLSCGTSPTTTWSGIPTGEGIQCGQARDSVSTCVTGSGGVYTCVQRSTSQEGCSLRNDTIMTCGRQSPVVPAEHPQL